MGAEPFPFDAVLFDLDGTLVATDRFWLRAANKGARAAFAELGLDRALPLDDAWMSLVGLPLERGFDALFPDLDRAARSLVQRRCVEAEHEELSRGGAELLPGAAETLRELRRRGARLGIASNCDQAYLDAMLGGLGLGALVDEARCLESPGCADKAEMVADLLRVFATRRAAMVGDRRGDAEAAHANGLPHVHLCGGFAQADEAVPCEATLPGLAGLVELLEGPFSAVVPARRAPAP